MILSFREIDAEFRPNDALPEFKPNDAVLPNSNPTARNSNPMMPALPEFKPNDIDPPEIQTQ